MGATVEMRLRLTSDLFSVALARHAVDAVLAALGACRACRQAVALLVGEACGNVVRHAATDQGYEVLVRAGREGAEIDVTDHGAGFTPEKLTAGLPDSKQLNGRGMHIINTLADAVQISAPGPVGALVHMLKTFDCA